MGESGSSSLSEGWPAWAGFAGAVGGSSGGTERWGLGLAEAAAVRWGSGSRSIWGGRPVGGVGAPPRASRFAGCNDSSGRWKSERPDDEGPATEFDSAEADMAGGVRLEVGGDGFREGNLMGRPEDRGAACSTLVAGGRRGWWTVAA